MSIEKNIFMLVKVFEKCFQKSTVSSSPPTIWKATFGVTEAILQIKSVPRRPMVSRAPV